MATNPPMVASVGEAENARNPKPAMVVSAVIVIARPIERMAAATLPSSRPTMARWTPLSTPMPTMSAGTTRLTGSTGTPTSHIPANSASTTSATGVSTARRDAQVAHDGDSSKRLPSEGEDEEQRKLAAQNVAELVLKQRAGGDGDRQIGEVGVQVLCDGGPLDALGGV